MPRESKVKKRERAIEFCARMDELYPQPTPALDFSDPFQCVVAVALSAQTTEREQSHSRVVRALGHARQNGPG